MTTQEALAVLAEATEPGTMPRITRAGFVQIEQAIQVLREALHPSSDPSATGGEKPPKEEP